MSYDYDLFVIGAGSGGVRCSRIASQLGAKVAVAEDLYLGGTCVNVGCVPKKLFVYASEYSKDFKSAAGFGWNVDVNGFNWPKLRDSKTAEIDRLNGVYGNILASAGVETIRGRATIVDPHTVSVNGHLYTSKYILVAVGGWPVMPTFEGAEHCINSNDIFSLPVLPKRILVQGGGYIAVEFAGIFNGLGCETELIYRGPLFLRGFDEEVRHFVKTQIESHGVKLSFDTDIEKVTKQADNSLLVTYKDGRTTEVDGVFSAIGRRPKTANLGLEKTSVKLNARGAIEVDSNFQTAEPSIFAVGDVVGRMELTPVALAEGSALAHYLFNGDPIHIDYDNIATVVFCQPSIGTVGLTEEQAEAQFGEITVYTSAFKPMKNTLGGSQDRMFMKLVVDKQSQKVLGCHVVGDHAGEIVQAVAIAIRMGATKQDFDSTIGIHPTAAEELVTMRTPRD